MFSEYQNKKIENDIILTSNEILELETKKGLLSEIKPKNGRILKELFLIETQLIIKYIALATLTEQLNSPFGRNLK